MPIVAGQSYWGGLCGVWQPVDDVLATDVQSLRLGHDEAQLAVVPERAQLGLIG